MLVRIFVNRVLSALLVLVRIFFEQSVECHLKTDPSGRKVLRRIKQSGTIGVFPQIVLLNL